MVLEAPADLEVRAARGMIGMWAPIDQVDELLTMLGKINLAPDFTLSADQKNSLKAVADAYLKARDEYRKANADKMADLRKQIQEAMQNQGPGQGPGTDAADAATQRRRTQARRDGREDHGTAHRLQRQQLQEKIKQRARGKSRARMEEMRRQFGPGGPGGPPGGGPGGPGMGGPGGPPGGGPAAPFPMPTARVRGAPEVMAVKAVPVVVTAGTLHLRPLGNKE